MAISLPQDLILFEIITRVPPKSAVRFKCVSKQWNSFLKSDMFMEMHNDHNLVKDNVCTHLKDQNLFFLSQRKGTFYTIDCESPLDNAPYSRPLPQFAAHPPQYIKILTSYHGLLCLHISYNENKDDIIILWNPVTTEFKRLPSTPFHMPCLIDVCGLYYSSDEDDYKLLVVTESNNAYIYSLKCDSWRKLDTNSKFLFQEQAWNPGFYLSKYLYFLSRSKKIECSMRFDTKARTFHELKTPPVRRYYRETSITVQKGSIHFCVIYAGSNMELWKYIADEDIWSMVVNYQAFLHYYNFGHCWSLLHLMSNGNLLMKDNYYIGASQLFQVKLIKTKEKKHNHGQYYDKRKLLYRSRFKVDYHKEVIYTETFASPNRYMKKHTLSN